MAHAMFRLGDLMAIIGDNSAADRRRAGYNGLWSLKHRTEPTDVFVPAVAEPAHDKGERKNHDIQEIIPERGRRWDCRIDVASA